MRPHPAAVPPSLLAEAICGADRIAEALAGEPLYEKLTDTDKDEIEKIIRKELRGKSHTTQVEKVVKEVLRRFAQVFYNRRGFWINEL